MRQQPAGGPWVSLLADGGGGCGAAAAGAWPPAPPPTPTPTPGSLSVFLLPFYVSRWWERGLGRPTLAWCRPPIQPLQPR